MRKEHDENYYKEEAIKILTDVLWSNKMDDFNWKYFFDEKENLYKTIIFFYEIEKVFEFEFTKYLINNNKFVLIKIVLKDEILNNFIKETKQLIDKITEKFSIEKKKLENPFFIMPKEYIWLKAIVLNLLLFHNFECCIASRR